MARAALNWARQAGFTHITFSPGSRSAPILHVAREQGWDMTPCYDERSAAFHAVGRAKAGAPSIVVATSGTAIANWHPAAVEAAQAELPVLFLSADRPATMVGSGSNQTIDQVGIFEPQITTHDVSDGEAPTLEGAGPFHINLRFEEPILQDGAPAPWPTSTSRNPSPPTVLDAGKATVVLGCLPEGPGSQAHGQRVLADLRVRHAYPGSGMGSLLSEQAPELLGESCVQVDGRSTSMSLDAHWRLAGLEHVYAGKRKPRLQRTPDGPEATWQQQPGPFEVSTYGTWPAGLREALQAWAGSCQYHGAVLSQFLSSLREPGFVGSSLAIRDLDRFAIDAAAPIFHARGASGIDGNLSMIAGLSQVLGPLWAWVGDLTFLHDTNGLQLLKDTEARLVVVDDQGGQIFSRMAYRDWPSFETDFQMPPGVDLAGLCAAHGLKARVLEEVGELERAWGSDAQVLILRVNPEHARELYEKDLERLQPLLAAFKA